MIKGLLKFFGMGDSAPAVSSVAASGDGSVRDLESFVDYVVKALVDAPDQVRIVSEQDNGSTVIKINCKKEDIGKIVGKNGKTIMAIRSLVSGAAGRMQKRVAVEVVD